MIHIKYKILNTRYSPGFTLIEALVAISVLTLAFVSFLTLVTLSLQSFNASRDKFVAGKIAQEGLELIINKRDNNLLCLKSGTCSLCDWRKELATKSLGVSCTFPGGLSPAQWEVDATLPGQLLPESTPGHNNDFTVFSSPGRKICLATGINAGKFKHCTGMETPIPGDYTREMRVHKFGDCSRLRVQSIITWQGKLGPQSLTLEEVLFGLPEDSGVCTTSGGPGSVSSEGLVAHWKLDEPTTGGIGSDSSGNGNNGTLVGGPISVPGAPALGGGEALNFDGINDFVNIGDARPITQAFTFSAWIKLDTAPADIASIIHKLQVLGSNTFLIGITPTLQVRLNYTGPGEANHYSAPSKIPLGIWTHVAGTRDGATSKIYINGGVPESTVVSAEPGGLLYGTRILAIGSQDGTDRFFDGSIDDVQIYNRVLSDGEVGTTMGGSTVAGLVGHWKFDTGFSPTTAIDSSGNNNNGTLYSGATECSDPPTTGCPTWVTGQIGGALEFDGVNDYVDIANSPSLQITGDITISFWMNSSAFDTLDNAVGKGNCTYQIRRGSGPDIDKMRFDIRNATCTDGSILTLHSDVVPNNEWHHIAAVYNTSEGKGKIYHDGLLKNEVLAAGAMPVNSDPVYIGKHEFAGREWNGLLDDVRIYSRVLTQDEIVALHDEGIN